MTPSQYRESRRARPCSEKSRFSETYRVAVDDVLRCLTDEMQEELSRHNRGWKPGSADFPAYLRASEMRYSLAFDSLGGQHLGSLCDIGGLWGAFPVAAKRLGIRRVIMTEALKYYSRSFDGLFSWISAQGVEVVDYDPFEEQAPPFDKVEAVSVMAVLEHYPHSLRGMLGNVRAAVAPAGTVYIEVPNIAYLPKRLALLSGLTPLVPAGDIFDSEVPFTGHHHEFTEAELLDICGRVGFRVEELRAYNYSGVLPTGTGRLRSVLRHPAMAAVYWRWPSTREVLAATCSTDGG